MTDSHDPGGAKRAAGVVIDTGAGLWFVPTEHALAVLDDPRLSDVPGTQLQMLWFEGHVVPAVSWRALHGADAVTAPTERRASASRRAESALVCELGGQTLALVGVWAVADGVGGHQEGEVASRMVCDALADFVPDASFEQAIEAAGERIQQVNAQLVRSATREHNPVRSGSTVVALLARGTRCAILWAGDSRVYRLREGQLDQLTRDHSVAESAGAADVATTAITRAVGAEALLTLGNPGARHPVFKDGGGIRAALRMGLDELRRQEGPPVLDAELAARLREKLGEPSPIVNDRYVPWLDDPNNRPLLATGT